MKDALPVDYIYEKIHGVISSWDVKSVNYLHKQMPSFKDDKRITIVAKNKVILNPSIMDSPFLMEEFRKKIAIITTPLPNISIETVERKEK